MKSAKSVSPFENTPTGSKQPAESVAVEFLYALTITLQKGFMFSNDFKPIYRIELNKKQKNNRIHAIAKERKLSKISEVR